MSTPSVISRPVFRTKGLVALAALTLAACAGEDPLFSDLGGAQQGSDGGAAQGDGGALEGLTCVGNNDGVIELGEVRFEVGLAANYRVNPPGTQVAVDVAGTRDDDGRVQWAMESREGGIVRLGPEAVGTAWFAGRFPDAQLAVSDITGETLQLISIDGGRVLLHGLASRAPDRTLLVYDRAVELLRFPMRVGDRFVSEGQVNDGTLEGLPIATRDTYTVEVDALGAVRLPFVRLARALRVRVDVTSRAIGGAVAHTRQVQWFAECYAEVARAVSATTRDPEVPARDFATAVEFRRLSF